jgi:NAD(P)H-dependent FMN reductase
MKISVIVGSTRQGRFSEKPAQWILQQLQLLDVGFYRPVMKQYWP